MIMIMTLIDLMTTLARLGLRLKLEPRGKDGGGCIAVFGPKKKLTPRLKKALREHKPQLLQLLGLRLEGAPLLGELFGVAFRELGLAG